MAGEAWMMRLTTVMLAVLMLAGCGRVGPPRPPGPPEAVTFPRAYPAPPPMPVEGETIRR
ncbi:hypothetical protein H7965_07770 [Siccirubricoccus deserti]|uniref:Lipoprotein n=2 Tax=Siccirubricoccus deserti TaxID=2013562 RepID=A0A9X0UD63_9PROT|nr:hypothetical protein [Siccirubricoccus deserti]